MLSLKEVLIATFFIMLITIIERAFPFLLFSRKNPPKIIRFIERYIPPMVMAALLLYCIKDISFISNGNIDLKGFVPYTIGIISTILLHIWKRNSLISIFGGTGIFMILIRVL